MRWRPWKWEGGGMGALTQSEIAALLETGGADPRGKGQDCAKCGGVRTVTHTDEVFYCHKCEWKGNTFTLAKELGVYRRLPSAEYRELCRTRELAREAQEEKVRVRVRMARERAAREWSSLRLAPSDHP